MHSNLTIVERLDPRFELQTQIFPLERWGGLTVKISQRFEASGST
jgi:hypothetical protein